jgi:hypothetical protein
MPYHLLPTKEKHLMASNLRESEVQTLLTVGLLHLELWDRLADNYTDSDPTRNIIRVEPENNRAAIEEIPTRPFYGPDSGYQPNFTPPDLIPFNTFFPPYQMPPQGLNYLPTNGANPLPPNVTSPPNYPPPGEPSYLDSQPQPWPAEEPTEYARTLIGPLAAGAQTLNDNNDEPGVFFLFQDLSVRTEGVFRLRMRLVNVGGCVPPLDHVSPAD